MLDLTMPRLPYLCTICMHAKGQQTVPDRDPIHWRFDVMCPICFDSFLDLFPLTVKKLQRRELTGKLI